MNFDCSRSSATFPGSFKDELMFEGAKLQDVVKSQIRFLPSFQVKYVRPSGYFPSVADKPFSSEMQVCYFSSIIYSNIQEAFMIYDFYMIGSPQL